MIPLASRVAIRPAAPGVRPNRAAGRPGPAWAAALVALALLLLPATAPGQETEHPRDGLWRFSWRPTPVGPISRAHEEARQRLQRACSSARLDCLRAHHDDRDLILDTLRREPDPRSAPAGVLVARLSVRPIGEADPGGGRLGYDLVLRHADGAGETVVRALGDWSYGVDWYVGARSGPSVPLPGTEGWIDTGEGEIHGELTPAEGDLVTLEEPVAARRVGGEGGEVRLAAGREREVFFVVDVDGATVRLRPEQPSDMPCPGDHGQEADDPDPVVYTVPVEALFRPDGTALVGPAHPRGC